MHIARTDLVDWWNEDRSSLHRSVFDTVHYINSEQKSRFDTNMRSLRLYGNYSGADAQFHSFSYGVTPNLPENRIKLNIICSMVDTVSAKISKMKPRVTFLTEGGNWSTQQKAKKLSKFTDGLFYKNNTYITHRQAFRDSLIFDMGAVKHYIEDGCIKSERILPTELFVDYSDGMYGQPQCLYQIKQVRKSVLVHQYPNKEAIIQMSSSSLSVRDNYQSAEKDEYVLVIEAWHLPSTKDSGDGRHIICVEKGNLVDEEYTKDYFPFTFFRWSPAVLGFYGQSLSERLTGNQIEINKMLRIIQRSFHLGSAFKVFLEYGSKVAKDHINNEIGSIVYYQGKQPSFYTPQTVHPEFFNHLQWLIQSSYEEAGVSQLSSASKLPGGIDGGSGKAIREYNDLETERFILVAQDYEQSFLDTAKIYIDLAKDLHEAGEDLEVKAESKKFIESIKWSEVNLDADAYVMKMFPTSKLPKEPAGLLAYVQELVQAGFVDMDFARKLLDFPDVESYNDLKSAPLDDILDTLDQMLDKGKYLPPEPFQALEKGIEIMEHAYLKARKDGAPDSRLELVRRWLASAEMMISQAQQPQQPPPQQMGGMVPAPGQPMSPEQIAMAQGAMSQGAPMPPEMAQGIPQEVPPGPPQGIPQA